MAINVNPTANDTDSLGKAGNAWLNIFVDRLGQDLNANNKNITNVQSLEIEHSSSNSILIVTGATGADARILVERNANAAAGDAWQMVHANANAKQLSFQNDVVSQDTFVRYMHLDVTSQTQLGVFGRTGQDTQIVLQSTTSQSSIFTMITDDAASNGDTWQLALTGSDQLLVWSNDISGSLVSKMQLGTDGRLGLAGNSTSTNTFQAINSAVHTGATINATVYVANTNASSTGTLMYLNHSGTGLGIDSALHIESSTITTGQLLWLEQNTSTYAGSGGLLKVSGTTGQIANFDGAHTNNMITMDNTSTGGVLAITSAATTGTGGVLSLALDSLTTGAGFRTTSTNITTGSLIQLIQATSVYTGSNGLLNIQGSGVTTGNVTEFLASSSSFSGQVLSLRASNASNTGRLLFLNQDGNGPSIVIDSEAAGATVFSLVAANTSGTAMVVNNAGVGGAIVDFQDGGTSVFKIADGGGITVTSAGFITTDNIQFTGLSTGDTLFAFRNESTTDTDAVAIQLIVDALTANKAAGDIWQMHHAKTDGLLVWSNDIAVEDTLVSKMQLSNGGELQVTGDVNANGGVFRMAEITTPSAVTNFGKIYTKSDNALYFQDGAGVEHTVTIS